MPAAVAQHIISASVWETAPVGSRPLVLLIHVLGAVAATETDSPVESSTTEDCPEGIGTASPKKLIKQMEQSALQHVKQAPAKDFEIRIDQEDIVPTLLRSVVLLLKIADLTPLLAATEDASALLWRAIEALARNLTAYTKPSTTAQQQQLGLVLVQLILRMLGQTEGIWQAFRSTSCFQIMTSLVAWHPTQSIALSAICTKGNNASVNTSKVAYSLHVTYTPHACQQHWHCSTDSQSLPSTHVPPKFLVQISAA